MEEKVILVLEDEIPLLNAIKKKLETEGCTVVTARSVEQGMEYLEELDHIDAIWLDHYLLGKESGLDFVNKIKADESPWKKVPVFVVSNTASQDKVNQYLNLGVEKYYIKAEHRLEKIVEDMKESLLN
ncbi:hypothetical protein C0580_03480 [Candidatus Parcubacteria bacterium]|nr:MAG: hypothetical protein C0580_03480 [Candidatus Parcubacteria bacterium]